MEFDLKSLFVPDSSPEKWCQNNSLVYSSLKTAEAVRSELTDTLNRLELPISEASFGTKTNTQNIKRALLAGFFMQVCTSSTSLPEFLRPNSPAGLNYVIDLDRSRCGRIWKLLHSDTLSFTHSPVTGPSPTSWGCQNGWFSTNTCFQKDNCIRTVSEISLQV